RRDHGAARLASAKEGLAVDFLGHRVVDDVARLDALVLRAQPGVDPERLDAHDLLLLVAHRPGHVHHVDDDRVRLRKRLGLPGAIALVLTHRHDHGVLGVVAAHGELALERLLEGAAEVAQRLGAGLPDAGVAILLGDDALFALGLDARKLQLLAQDLGQLLHRDLDLEQVLAGTVAGAALARLRVALAQRVARLAVALPDAPGRLGPEAEVRDVDLGQRDGHQILAPLADHLALRDVFAQVLLDLAAHDLAEAPVVLV